MPVRGINLGVAHVPAVIEQRLDQFPAAFGGEAPVGGEAHEQKACAGTRQRTAQVAAEFARRVEIIQRTGNQQIRIGVEVLGKFIPLVTQIALDLEFHVLGGVLVLAGSGRGTIRPRSVTQ